jgi:hypothetical protein
MGIGKIAQYADSGNVLCADSEFDSASKLAATAFTALGIMIASF